MTTEYSVDNVYKCFNNVIDQQSIRLHEFIIAFRELAKFFDHLNVVFSFVAYDLADKFVLIESLCKNDPVNYRTVQSMIEHERNKEDRCGTIALLRLLRALEFTYLFLQGAVVSTTATAAPKHVAWDVYKQTLHKRHHKAVRLSIWCATATLPKRENLRQTLLRGETEPGTADKCFPMIGDVYNGIHRVYEENNLLELVAL